MDPLIIKLLDYGVLGVATCLLGCTVYRLSKFIVGKFEDAQQRCEADRQRMIGKLEEKDRVLAEISNRCIAATDANTKATQELCAEIRLRRTSDTEALQRKNHQ